MRILHHANACFSLFHRDLHILCDPWIEGPAVAGGWSQFPPVQTRFADLPPIDYVYISHIHSDHCNEESLSKIKPSTPIVIMDLKPGFLEKMLRAKGFENLILIPEKQRIKIASDFHAEAFSASFGHICANIIDSSVLFDFGDFTFLNCNDNKPSQDLCRYVIDKYKTIDLALLPVGGGSGYPAMYDNLSPTEKESITRNAVSNYTKQFVTAVDELHPRAVIPVAGGYAIRGPEAETVNWYQARRFDQREVVDFYASNGKWKDVKIIPMQSGMEMDAEKATIIKGEYHAWTEAELRTHFSKLSQETLVKKVTTTAPIRNFSGLWGAARKQLWEKQTRLNMFPEYTIYLDVPSERQLYELRLDQAEGKSISREINKRGPYLQMTMDQDTALEWLLGYEDFNMLDSGHRIHFFRQPNQYVVEAYYLMSMFRLI